MSALQSWMKVQDVFDQDLHDLLMEYGVVNAPNDLRDIDRTQWDRIVASLESLKEGQDRRSRTCLERKFLKLERIWTTLGDLEDGSREWHKNTRTKKKRRSSHHHTLQPKTRKKGKKDHSSGSSSGSCSESSHSETKTKKKRAVPDQHKKKKGVALKLWLHRNHCYLDALYRELIKKGADSPKRIQSLSKPQLDAIVRKVRVERFGQFKDQTACTRFVAGFVLRKSISF